MVGTKRIMAICLLVLLVSVFLFSCADAKDQEKQTDLYSVYLTDSIKKETKMELFPGQTIPEDIIPEKEKTFTVFGQEITAGYDQPGDAFLKENPFFFYSSEEPKITFAVEPVSQKLMKISADHDNVFLPLCPSESLSEKELSAWVYHQIVSVFAIDPEDYEIQTASTTFEGENPVPGIQIGSASSVFSYTFEFQQKRGEYLTGDLIRVIVSGARRLISMVRWESGLDGNSPKIDTEKLNASIRAAMEKDFGPLSKCERVSTVLCRKNERTVAVCGVQYQEEGQEHQSVISLTVILD